MARRYPCLSCGHVYTDHLVTVLCEQLAFCEHTELLVELEELLELEDPETRLEATGNLYALLTEQVLSKGFDMRNSKGARDAFKRDLVRIRQLKTEAENNG